MQGFVPASGTGPTLIVAEAAGADEEQLGEPLVGKSGMQLFQELQRVGLSRDQFTIHNVLSCRPKDNKLAGMPYEREVITHCEPNLDSTIRRVGETARTQGKTFVIVALGNTAFKRILGLDPKRDHALLKADFYAYPFWSDKYQAWVLAAPHPAFLVRGNTHLWPVVHYVFLRAIEIAQNGLKLDETDYTLDPDSYGFQKWVDGYLSSLNENPENELSYDIETPYKKKAKNEDELSKEEAELTADHTILRCSFSYFVEDRAYTTSIKWSAEYMADVERIFKLAPFVLGWNSDKYDLPRVSRYLKVGGISLDSMVAWHFLNTSLPKALGFVTPFYWQNTLMWKHLSESEPAFYNAKDAHAALINYRGIKKDLIVNRLWPVYQRHWIDLSKALKFMGDTGVLMDAKGRDDAEAQLTDLLVGIEEKMEAAVPQDARKLKIYKKTPKVINEITKKYQEAPFYDENAHQLELGKTGLIQVSGELDEKQCLLCGEIKPKKPHSALCMGEVAKVKVPATLWAKPLEFKVSKNSLLGYQASLRHQAIKSRKENKVTFDADAIVKLAKKYPKDPLYPSILEHRKVQKLRSTYVGYHLPNGKLWGGMPVGPDGRIHTVFGRNASTLRFTSEDPNLQNLPRPNPKNPSALANLIRNLIIAGPGNILYARDYSGIEAVLVGFFALDPKYIRLAKRDVHTYYTVHALYELEGGKRIGAADLPDIDWPDDRLFPYLEQLKKEFSKERNTLYKHLVHAANYMQGPMGARDKIFSETGIEYPVKTVSKVMDVYYSLFPSIKRWHWNVLEEASKDGFLRNPFDYVHRFNRAFDWTKEFGEWKKKPGPDANAIIAFKPQSTAVAIITEAILTLYYEMFEEAGQHLRLQVHDELLFECPFSYVNTLDILAKEVMEAPIKSMKLPASWNMGEHLVVLTEEKKGYKWGEMK
jgi:uracil-DNA glycosylase family 4